MVIRSIPRPGVGYVVAGRRGGFFKKLFKGVAKVAKVIAPAVVAVARTAAKHTVVGTVVTAVNRVKKLTAAGHAHANSAAGKASIAAQRGSGGFAKLGGKKYQAGAYAREAKSQGLKPRRKAKRKAKAKRGAGTAKQRAARARFARAAKKGRIKKGARL